MPSTWIGSEGTFFSEPSSQLVVISCCDKCANIDKCIFVHNLYHSHTQGGNRRRICSGELHTKGPRSQAEHHSRPQAGIEPRILLLWCDSARHWSTVIVQEAISQIRCRCDTWSASISDSEHDSAAGMNLSRIACSIRTDVCEWIGSQSRTFSWLPMQNHTTMHQEEVLLCQLRYWFTVCTWLIYFYTWYHPQRFFWI